MNYCQRVSFTCRPQHSSRRDAVLLSVPGVEVLLVGPRLRRLLDCFFVSEGTGGGSVYDKRPRYTLKVLRVQPFLGLLVYRIPELILVLESLRLSNVSRTEEKGVSCTPST